MRISDWSSDVCSSDLRHHAAERQMRCLRLESAAVAENPASTEKEHNRRRLGAGLATSGCEHVASKVRVADALVDEQLRSEEHTSELQQLVRRSYAVHCLPQHKP